jgi:hypothetical protein
MFHYFKIPYFTCNFFTKFTYNEYIGPYFLSHVVLRFSPSDLPGIPLCRMKSLPVVRPFLKNDVSQLATHFMIDGYMEGCGFFYVALEDNHGHTNDVTPSVVATWSPEWKEVNAEFEKKLLADEDLKIFSNKMFMVWDGNHRLQAWMPIIENFHTHDINWHFCVEGVILDPKGDVPSVIAALHEVNW